MKKNKLFILFFLLLFNLNSYADVNLKTGGLVDQILLGEDTHFPIVYRSRSYLNGFFGYGWCSPLDENLQFHDNQIEIDLCIENTKIILRKNKGSNQWIQDRITLHSRYNLELSKNQFLLQKNGEIIRKFNLIGKIIELKNQKDQFKFDYELSGKIKKIIGPQGSIPFQFEKNKITQFGESKIKIENSLLMGLATKEGTYSFKYDNYLNRVEKHLNNRRLELTIYDNDNDRVTSYFDQRKCLTKFQYKKMNDFKSRISSQRKCLNSLMTENIELVAEYKKQNHQLALKQIFIKTKTEKQSLRTGDKNDI